jgi:ATP phosphoribosyltransferase regulatory subunit
MPLSPATRAEAARLLDAFRAAGAVPVETDILQPADILLDLYGEDIRARAYVTHDPVRGEMMLRPDFTVPVVRAHMAGGATPARYCYQGLVFRQQDGRPGQPSEYLQVGYEVFDSAAADADAEVFALFAGLLRGLPVRAVTGDLGVIAAAVHGLGTTAARKAALLRHVWRPRRFRALLDRFAGRSAPHPARARLLAQLAATPPAALIAAAGPAIGLRTAEEVAARAAALLEDAEAPPIPAAEAAAMDDLLAVAGSAPEALARIADIAVDLPALAPAAGRMAARLAAFAAAGVDPAALAFEAAHGRTTMEYYDGFVFSFVADRPGLPPLASGGRYDALTSVLGQGRSIPAVGGVIRPAVVAALRGGA